MPQVDVPAFKSLNTTSNPRSADPLDLLDALNMVWDGNRVKSRLGSSLFKNTDQSNWGRVERLVQFKKLGDSFFYVVAVLSSGRVFYIKSNNANYGTASATWTEINNPSSGTPALAANATRYAVFGFNNLLYFADSTNGYFSWNGTDADLTAETDPTNLSTNNIVAFADKSSRLVALDDGGRTHLSGINDGTDFTGAGTGSLNYGRVEGLRATNLIPFGDDILITTEDQLTLRFQTYRLIGIQFFDPTVAGTDTSQFEVRKVNSIAGMIGDSAQEIADDTIGLTPRGVIGIQKALQAVNLTERDFISFPIKEIIAEINFVKADKIRSVVDYVNGRYMLAVPFGEDAQEANIILVYDFLRSSASEGIYRWTVWTFAFGEIGTLGVIAGVPYVTDIDGNIYKLNDSDANYADNSLAIQYLVKTAGIGGQQTGIMKNFGEMVVLFTDLSTTKFDMNVNIIKDGQLIAEDEDGDTVKMTSIEQLPIGLKYDTPGVNYDDFNYYDSGSDQRLVNFINKGGRCQSAQWVFSTNTTGVSWGIGGFSVFYEAEETVKQGGLNNYGDI